MTTARERLDQWWKRLDGATGSGTPAVEVYSGGHWAVVRSLPATAAQRGLDARLWVISAGYGLLPADARIHGYSATFAYGHEDSVGSRSSDLSEWWARLATKNLRGATGPRALTDLLLAEPGAAYLLVGSLSYLTAIEADLLRGMEGIAGQGSILVVSSRRALRGRALERHCVPSEAPLRHLVGGPLTSLHARVARQIILEADEHGFEPEGLTTRYEYLVKERRGVDVKVRARQSDDQVRRYIRKALLRESRVSQSRLLQMLRCDGLACEARRFKELYVDERRGRGVHVG